MKVLAPEDSIGFLIGVWIFATIIWFILGTQPIGVAMWLVSGIIVYVCAFSMAFTYFKFAVPTESEVSKDG